MLLSTQMLQMDAELSEPDKHTMANRHGMSLDDYCRVICKVRWSTCRPLDATPEEVQAYRQEQESKLQSMPEVQQLAAMLQEALKPKPQPKPLLDVHMSVATAQTILTAKDKLCALEYVLRVTSATDLLHNAAEIGISKEQLQHVADRVNDYQIARAVYNADSSVEARRDYEAALAGLDGTVYQVATKVVGLASAVLTQRGVAVDRVTLQALLVSWPVETRVKGKA